MHPPEPDGSGTGHPWTELSITGSVVTALPGGTITAFATDGAGLAAGVGTGGAAGVRTGVARVGCNRTVGRPLGTETAAVPGPAPEASGTSPTVASNASAGSRSRHTPRTTLNCLDRDRVDGSAADTTGTVGRRQPRPANEDMYPSCHVHRRRAFATSVRDDAPVRPRKGRHPTDAHLPTGVHGCAVGWLPLPPRHHLSAGRPGPRTGRASGGRRKHDPI